MEKHLVDDSAYADNENFKAAASRQGYEASQNYHILFGTVVCELAALEKMGAVSAIVWFFLYVLSESGPNSLSPFKPVILTIAVVLVIGTGAYYVAERYFIEPRIRLEPFNEEGLAVTQFKFVIQGRSKRFPHLNVQVSYGWGTHVTFSQRLKQLIHKPPEKVAFTGWLPLDLRTFTIEEVTSGKSGDPVTQLAIERHDLKMFTFATFYAEEKRVRFAVTEQPIQGGIFSNAILATPHPEIVAKFIGLPRPTVRSYVAVFNSPVKSSDRPAVDLIETKKRRAKALILERETTLGRIGKTKAITVFQKLPDGVLAQVSSEEFFTAARAQAQRVR
jgi:hypothetical protein